MNILVDGRVLTHKYYTGVEKYTYEIINAFKDLKVNLDVIYPNFKNRYYAHLWEHLFLPIKSKKYSILFCPANIAPVWKNKRVKLVVTLHDLSFVYFPESYSRTFRMYYKWVIPRVLKLADGIITVSESEKRKILEIFPEAEKKIVVIYSGLSKKYKNRVINFQKEDYILYVGSLNPRKNFQGVINAFLKICNKIPHKLKIVGRDFKIYKKQQVKKNERIEFLGYLNEEEIIKLYSKCSLFVFPSFHEAFGFPVLEAMGCGAPVVTSNTSCFPELVKDGAILVNPYNVEEISNAIVKVLFDKNLQIYLIKKGYEIAQNFCWIKTANQILDFFDKILCA